MPLPRLIDRALDASVVLGYTRVGYRVRAGGWVAELPTMDGVTVLVTGATGGIGRSTALGLASRGATVIAVGRSEEKLHALVRMASEGTVVPLCADLSLMDDIRRLAERILVDHEAIDVLVNNVGVLFPERTVTPEGIEATLATNLLGQFLLTNLLAPRLVRSAPARIVTVSSGGMYTQRVDVDDLESARGPWNGAKAYARTKRGQVILSEMWAERLAGTGVVSHAMHPGWADTAGVKRSLPLFRTVTAPLLRTPEQGADTVMWLAASTEAGETTGGFWHDRRLRPTHRIPSTRSDAAEREALWQRLTDMSGWSGDLALPG